MNRTQIEWVRNPDGSRGYTWNPITGCLNHDNGLCKGGGFPCYAYRLANGRLKPLYLANHQWTTCEVAHNIPALLDPFYPRFWEGRLNVPEPPSYKGYSKEVRFALQQRHKKGIFVCDMSDLFGIGVPAEWTQKVMSEVRMHPEHRFYLLTKQPQNLINFSPFPENCWVGVTVTNNILWNRAIDNLSQVKASVKFISFEPLLSVVGNTIDREDDPNDLAEEFWNCDIDWLIIGAQTKLYKPPKVERVKEIVKAADKAGVKVFLKDNLRPILPPEDIFGIEDFEYKWQIRQELPK